MFKCLLEFTIIAILITIRIAITAIDIATTTYVYEKMDATVSHNCGSASPIGWIGQSAVQILYILSS